MTQFNTINDPFCLKYTQPQNALELAEAWLDLGEVGRARRIFNQMTREQKEEAPGLEARIIESAEAHLLGYAVRPYICPASKRWEPALLPPERLAFWYGGRVLSVNENEVHLVLSPSQMNEETRIYHKIIPAKEWTQRWGTIPEEGQFLEAGEYEVPEAKRELQIRVFPREEIVFDYHVADNAPRPHSVVYRSRNGEQVDVYRYFFHDRYPEAPALAEALAERLNHPPAEALKELRL